jgi:hypothetical protein
MIGVLIKERLASIGAKRTKDHVLRFTRLYEQLGEEKVQKRVLCTSHYLVHLSIANGETTSFRT